MSWMKANKAYQVYRDLREWENQHSKLLGSKDAKNSLRWLEDQLIDITSTKPKELDHLKAERHAKTWEIHEQLHKLAEIFQELTAPVEKQIAKRPYNEMRNDKIEFAIRLVEYDLVDKVFGIVGHSSGTFSGVQEGRRLLQSLADKRDFKSPDDTIAFVEEVLDKLNRNHKVEPPAMMELTKLIRKVTAGRISMISLWA